MGNNRRNTEKTKKLQSRIHLLHLMVSCRPCTDNTDIANNFNIYFTTVGKTLAANLPQTDSDPIELIESNPEKNYFPYPPNRQKLII